MRKYEYLKLQAYVLLRMDLGASNCFQNIDEVPTPVIKRYEKTIERLERDQYDWVSIRLNQGQSTPEGRFLYSYLYNVPLQSSGYFADGGENTLTLQGPKRSILKQLKKLRVVVEEGCTYAGVGQEFPLLLENLINAIMEIKFPLKRYVDFSHMEKFKLTKETSYGKERVVKRNP